MAMEVFPRLREKEFKFRTTLGVPSRRQGRLDLIVGETYGAPMMYKAIAAYSRIVNPTAARPGIRIDSEALRNELILRGVKEELVDAEISRINEDRVVGERDWQGYSDNDNGVISSVDKDTVLMIPEMGTMLNWATRYANLQDDGER